MMALTHVASFKLHETKHYLESKLLYTNGNFSFTFIVPKDIAYNYGNGKLSFYAANNGMH